MTLHKSITALALVLASIGTASAHGGSSVHFGFGFGFPVYGGPYYAPYYYPPPAYYYPPPAYAAPAAPVYVEPPQNAAPAPQAQAAPPSDQYWYFCPDSKTYYPYVKSCSSAWQRVRPQPPGT